MPPLQLGFNSNDDVLLNRELNHINKGTQKVCLKQIITVLYIKSNMKWKKIRYKEFKNRKHKKKIFPYELKGE